MIDIFNINRSPFGPKRTKKRCKGNKLIVKLFNSVAIFLIFLPKLVILAQKGVEKFGRYRKIVYLCGAFEFKHQHQAGCPGAKTPI